MILAHCAPLPPHPNVNLPNPNPHLCSLLLSNFDLFLLSNFLAPHPSPTPTLIYPTFIYVFFDFSILKFIYYKKKLPPPQTPTSIYPTPTFIYVHFNFSILKLIYSKKN